MTAAPPALGQVGDARGGALRRWRWLLAAVIILLDASAWSTGHTVFADAEHAAWADWVAAGFIAYGVIGALGLVPRVIVLRARVEASEVRLALVRLAFAQTPFLIGFAALAAGAQPWICNVGFLAAAVLIVHAAVGMRE